MPLGASQYSRPGIRQYGVKIEEPREGTIYLKSLEIKLFKNTVLAIQDVLVDQVQSVIHVTLGFGHFSRCYLGKRTQAFFWIWLFPRSLLCFSSSLLVVSSGK